MGKINITIIVVVSVIVVAIIFAVAFIAIRNYINENDDSQSYYHSKPVKEEYPYLDLPDEAMNEIVQWKLNKFNFRIQVIEKYRSDNNYAINPKFTEFSHRLLSDTNDYDKNNVYMTMLNVFSKKYSLLTYFMVNRNDVNKCAYHIIGTYTISKEQIPSNINYQLTCRLNRITQDAGLISDPVVGLYQDFDPKKNIFEWDNNIQLTKQIYDTIIDECANLSKLVPMIGFDCIFTSNFIFNHSSLRNFEVKYLSLTYDSNSKTIFIYYMLNDQKEIASLTLKESGNLYYCDTNIK